MAFCFLFFQSKVGRQPYTTVFCRFKVMLHGTIWKIVLQQSCAQRTVDIILVALIHCAIFSLFYLTKVLCQLQIIFTITRETTSSAHAVLCNIPIYMHMYAFPEPYSLCITAMHFNIVYCVKYMYLLQDANGSTEHLCV